MPELPAVIVCCVYHQLNIVEPGKRPASFLMPIVVRPSIGTCGTYMTLCSSNADRALSGITQVKCHLCVR